MGEQKQGNHSGEATMRGTVKAVNFAPKGEIDGFLLDVGGETVQINVPPDRAQTVAALVGQTVEVKVGPEPKVADHPRGDHPAHKLVAFGGETEPAAHAKPEHKPHPHHDDKQRDHKHKHDHGEPVKLAGKVARLNYAKHGEANGVVLDSGDFLHLKPDGMKQVGLQVGHDVAAQGRANPSAAGRRAVETEVVNGVKIHHKP